MIKKTCGKEIMFIPHLCVTKFLDIASPGVLPFGIQTLYTPGSSSKQNTRPLLCIICSASMRLTKTTFKFLQ